MHLADWVPTLLGLAGVEPPTGEIILSDYSVIIFGNFLDEIILSDYSIIIL